ncbi:hypothetical protein [Echinicola sp. 20G]|uniref:hypothetical protein n=1 Tax=Echinicola sp. 20G TaxID=2781961 RepID=UPI00191051C7|nr:hypothetical protein [Echinicola sp. 20G]
MSYLHAILPLYKISMVEEIHNYYTAEKVGIPYVVLTGILLVVAAILILFKASAHPLSKGLSTGLLISGVLLIIIILSNKYYNDRMIKKLPDRIHETESELQQSEIQRMEKVMNISFRYSFLGFAGFITILTWLMVITSSYFWKGFFIGLLFLVLPILIADTYNSKRNKEYLDSLITNQRRISKYI